MKQIDHYLEIRELIGQNTDDKLLSELLEGTMTFLSSTHPSNQAKREMWLDNTEIENILQIATTALEDFKNTITDQTDDYPKKVFQSCKDAIIDRLNSLDETDKIFVYYHTEGNASELKSLLSPQSASESDSHTDSTRNTF